MSLSLTYPVIIAIVIMAVLLAGFIWFDDQQNVEKIKLLLSVRDAFRNFVAQNFFPPRQNINEISIAEEGEEANEEERGDSLNDKEKPKDDLEIENEEEATVSESLFELIQEELDDIEEKIDILAQEVEQLTGSSQSISKEPLEQLPENLDKQEISETKEKEDQETEEPKEEEVEETEELNDLEQENDEEEIGQEVGQVTCELEIDTQPFQNRIIFNEIAWMGTIESSNNEWIELKNISNSTIDLSGWQILDKEKQIKIIFGEKYVIQAGDFYLLERTDDNSVAGVSADKIYKGGLGDSDESLYLFNENCQLEDEAKANPNWQAGDKNSKRTMERKNNFAWQTSSEIGGTSRAENSQGYVEYYTSRGGGGISLPPSFYPKILISEIQIGSTTNQKDEFVELYNPNDFDIDLVGWYLQRKTKDANDYSSLAPSSLFSGKTIKARDYFLIVRKDSVFDSLGDVITPYSLTENNTLLLKNPAREIVDKVGFGDVQDSETAPALNPNPDQSLERKKDKDGFFIDTDNNAQDFFLQQNPNPKGQILYSIGLEAPVITSHQDNQFVNFSPVNLEGLAQSEISVLVSNITTDGIVATTSNIDGFFGCNLELKEGQNTIEIKATDESGKESEPHLLNLFLDTQAPIVDFNTSDLQTSFYFNLSWQGEDYLSGIENFLLQYTSSPSDIDGVNIQYQNELGDWQDWKEGEEGQLSLESQKTGLNLLGEDGRVYSFKIKARDFAENESNWAEITTRISLLKPILITEVQIEGEKIDNDFIELYNPNEFDVDIAGYKLRKRSSTGSESSVCVFPEGSIIKTKGYFLWANSKDDFHIILGADIWRTVTLAGNNSIALFGPEDEILDALAWGESNNPFLESTAFSENPGANKSLSRKWDAVIQDYQDTNNNLEDFQIQNPSPKEKNG